MLIISLFQIKFTNNCFIYILSYYYFIIIILLLLFNYSFFISFIWICLYFIIEKTKYFESIINKINTFQLSLKNS